MGCEYIDYTHHKCGKSDLIARHEDVHRTACYNDGHGGYTGTFAEVPNVVVNDTFFETREAAETWCEEHAIKWEAAQAVKVGTEDDWFWYVGANASS